MVALQKQLHMQMTARRERLAEGLVDLADGRRDDGEVRRRALLREALGPVFVHIDAAAAMTGVTRSVLVLK